jgi:SprT protein
MMRLLNLSMSLNLMTDTDTPEKIIRLAEKAVRTAEDCARRYYAVTLPYARTDYSLRGRCAGQARVAHSGQTFLRFNLQLLTENLEDFLQQTIPHEVAHLVVNWRHRKKRARPKPHGPEWQAVMQDCYGLQPTRCHSYQTTAARVVARNFLYECNCREHRLTRIIHNRISRRYKALCKKCRTPLRFKEEELART